MFGFNYSLSASTNSLLSFYSKVLYSIVKILNPLRAASLEYLFSFLTLSLIFQIKRLAFGQIDLFQSIVESLLTIPTFEVVSVKMSSISKEQIELSLSSNCIQYLNRELESFLYFSSEVHRFLWPNIFYVLLIICLLKIIRARKFNPKNPKYFTILETSANPL